MLCKCIAPYCSKVTGSWIDKQKFPIPPQHNLAVLVKWNLLVSYGETLWYTACQRSIDKSLTVACDYCQLFEKNVYCTTKMFVFFHFKLASKSRSINTCACNHNLSEFVLGKWLILATNQAFRQATCLNEMA